ncbi:MAG TPA: hypothetical protein VIL30_22715 [Ramlibacter sp.]|jgi:hypothetical protein
MTPIEATPRKGLLRTVAAVGAACLLAFGPLAAHADAGALRAKHGELREQLRTNVYQRALHIDSTEAPNSLQGDVYAVLDHPFERVRDSLKEPAAWCDVMLLPFNTKYCRASDAGGDQRLSVRIGRKYNQPAEQAFKIDFQFRNTAATADYLETRVTAKEGPVGTRDYRIRVEAVPLPGGKTFMHLSYAYGYGTASRMAMSAYLSTAGADKIGFSVTGKDASGQPQYIDGMRGAIERNAMRYYLAIDAYLDSPGDQQIEQRIQQWFTASERYPRQLREMDRATYVTMKRAEYERQQTAALN